MSAGPALTPESLNEIPLFSTLSPAQCEVLLERHLQSKHAPDQTFVLEQDWGESLFVLCSGMAKVRTYTSDGDEIVMSVLGPGDVFGEMAALEGGHRSADVVSLTPVVVVKLRANPFEALISKEPSFAMSFAKLMAQRLRDLNLRFAIQSSDATTRLLNSLAYLAVRSTKDKQVTSAIPLLAQRELGLLAGLSRETTSRTLSKLKSKGTIVEENDSLLIKDLNALIKRGLLPNSHR